jgi:N-acetyl-gamma-glutamyl-phosphate reductase
MEKLKVGIVGGSGYGGSELLRILLFHPQVEICVVTANEHAGDRVDQVHPNLRQLTDLVFAQPAISDELTGLDCIFLALPHGESMKLVPRLPDGMKVIDLAGDFRLNDAQVYEQYYGHAHTAWELQRRFVYGLTEIHRRRIANAQFIANPGCFATAILLGLYPLMAHQIIQGKIIVDAKTGSSGSGAKPAATTHHPKRTNSFFAYKAFAHQHLPEVIQTLQAVNPEWQESPMGKSTPRRMTTGHGRDARATFSGQESPMGKSTPRRMTTGHGRDARATFSGEDLIFQAHSAPMVRGIFASIYCSMRSPLTAEQVADIFKRTYQDCFFVRLVEGSPDVNWVKNTNFADIGWATKGTDLVIFAALDNLVKGAAGQAVQNMNLMFGLEEQTGLIFAGSHP